MKNLILLVIICLFASLEANARKGVPYCSDCEYIQVVHDLPDTEDFLAEDDSYLDIAYIYKQFWVLWIPIWNKEGKYCLATGEEDSDIYYELTAEQLQEIATANNAELSSNPISFWNKIGGKLVIIVILSLVAWGYLGKSDDKEEDEEELQAAA